MYYRGDPLSVKKEILNEETVIWYGYDDCVCYRLFFSVFYLPLYP